MQPPVERTMADPSPTDLFDADFLARLEHLRVMAKRLAAGPSAGRRRSRRLGDGLEFADHRSYVSGDDPRFIDWAYYARTDRLLRRLFHEHSEAGVAILLDVSQSMAAEGAVVSAAPMATFDFARRLAAAIAYVALASLERLTLLPLAENLGDGLTLAGGRGGIFGVLDFLSALTPSGRTDLVTSARQFAARIDRPTTVLLITDLHDCGGALTDALAHLQQGRCDVTVVHVFSPGDAEATLAGAVTLVAAEGAERLDVTNTAELLEAYAHRWRAFVAAARQGCLSRGAIYVPARSDVQLERVVLRSLRRAGVLVA